MQSYGFLHTIQNNDGVFLKDKGYLLTTKCEKLNDFNRNSDCMAVRYTSLT